MTGFLNPKSPGKIKLVIFFCMLLCCIPTSWDFNPIVAVLFLSKTVFGRRLSLLKVKGNAEKTRCTSVVACVGSCFRASIMGSSVPHANHDLEGTLASAFRLTLLTDSKIAPPPEKTVIFLLTNVSWLLDTRNYAVMKSISSCIPLVCKGLSNEGVGMARGTVL